MNKESPILYAFYDLEVSPNSFDFSAFLICAETKRRQLKATGIHVIIVPQVVGDGHHDNQQFDSDHSRWRLLNIIAPLTQLLHSCIGLTICNTRDEASVLEQSVVGRVFPESYTVEAPVARHHTGWTIIDAHLGNDVQYFRATAQARRYARQWIDSNANGKKCVAITLREATFGENRNSDLNVWGEFAQRLIENNYFPVVLRDIQKALDDLPRPFTGIASFPAGVFNLDLRMAFYEECNLCAFVANGPGQVCFYSKNIQFIYLVTGDWLDKKPTPFGRIGINFGETPPFANEFQRWIWQKQDPDILLKELTLLDADIDRSNEDGSYISKLNPLPEYRLPLTLLTERFFEWSVRAYGLLNEEAELAEACLSLIETEPRQIHGELTDGELEKFRLSKLLNIALGSKNLEKAVSILMVIGEKFGHTQQEIVQLGVIHEAMAKPRESISFYERALEMKPDSMDLHFRIGITSKLCGDLPKARHHFETLLHNGSNYPDLFSELGALYEQLDLAELAFKCYEIGEKRGALSPAASKRKLQLSNLV